MLKHLGFIAIAVGLALTSASRAEAQTCTYNNTTITTCDQLPAPIYLSGSTALRPLYKTLGKELITATTPGAVVFLTAGQGSCTGVLAQTGGTQIAASTNALWINDQGMECGCTIPSAVDVTVGVADVFGATCGLSDTQLTTAGLQDFHGPVNAMTFVTTKDSTANAISAEQAYLVFGFGAMYGVAPWLDPSFYWIRPDVSGTLRMLAAYTLNNIDKWLGYRAHSGAGVGCPDPTAAGCSSNGSGDVFTALVMGNSSTDRDKYIGILGLDYLLTSPMASAVKVLAFRGFKQRYAYYPDSTPTGTDHRNVRDGHYMAQGPAHFFVKVDGSGTPTNATAAQLVSRITNAMSATDTASQADLTSLITTTHLTPTCAMKVQRTVDGGDLSLFTPSNPCDCFFELTAGSTATPGCANAAPKLNECTSSTSCPASSTCRRGVCETR